MAVQTGSDVWASAGYFELAGMRIGFVGNQTALLSDGCPTLSALAASPDVAVKALFAPEHGAFGTFDDDVPDQVEPITGLKIHSLYGEHRKPSPEMLSGLDALVFEMQDIGARFYTYASTLGLCLEACNEAGIELIVLDRPNPITGLHCEGPCADEDRLSFTSYHTIPVRHGLTLGELALLYAHEKGFGPRLRVAKCEGWQRSMWFDETGIPWVNPSPAMRNLRAAALYPGLCLLEQTNIALGRGTDCPFERIGAPYIDSDRFVQQIRAANPPGITVEPDRFTPTLREFIGEECHGARITISNRETLNAVHLGLVLINALQSSQPDFDSTRLINLIANQSAYGNILDGMAPADVAAGWIGDLAAWETRRAPHLLYR